MTIDNTLLEELKAIADDENGNPIPVRKMNRLIIAGELAIIKQLNAFEVSIESLKKNTPDKFLTRNWKAILIILTVFFLVIHAMIPADVSLWTLVGKFFTG